MGAALQELEQDVQMAHRRSPFWRRFATSTPAALSVCAVGGMCVVALSAPILPLSDPDAIASAQRLLPPGASGYLLGSDELGRDVLSRMVWGARVSLLAGFGSALLAMVIGGLVGLIAGFYGGWLDDVLMRSTDAVLAFPSILLAIGVVAALGPGLTNAMIAVAITGFPLYARVVRGSVLIVRELDYVEAARAVGVRQSAIIFRHVLPNILAPIIVTLSLDVGSKIIVTSSLSFLGLGAQPPTADWGNMIAFGRQYMRTALHLIVVPGLAIFVVVLCLNVIGDRLRDVLDPRLRNT